MGLAERLRRRDIQVVCITAMCREIGAAIGQRELQSVRVVQRSRVLDRTITVLPGLLRKAEMPLAKSQMAGACDGMVLTELMGRSRDGVPDRIG